MTRLSIFTGILAGAFLNYYTANTDPYLLKVFVYGAATALFLDFVFGG